MHKTKRIKEEIPNKMGRKFFEDRPLRKLIRSRDINRVIFRVYFPLTNLMY